MNAIIDSERLPDRRSHQLATRPDPAAHYAALAAQARAMRRLEDGLEDLRTLVCSMGATRQELRDFDLIAERIRGLV